MRVRSIEQFVNKNTYFSGISALSLAASMFESAYGESENLANTNTELFILGIKYTTPNGD